MYFLKFFYKWICLSFEHDYNYQFLLLQWLWDCCSSTDCSDEGSWWSRSTNNAFELYSTVIRSFFSGRTNRVSSLNWFVSKLMGISNAFSCFFHSVRDRIVRTHIGQHLHHINLICIKNICTRTIFLAVSFHSYWDLGGPMRIHLGLALQHLFQ